MHINYYIIETKCDLSELFHQFCYEFPQVLG